MSGPADHADAAVHAPRGAAAIFDARAVAAELKRLGGLHAGRERELRSAVAQYLKGVQAEGRAAAERMLREDRHGRLCAERLCFMQDELIRLLFEFAGPQVYRSDNASEAERIGANSPSGYGRGLLGAGFRP